MLPEEGTELDRDVDVPGSDLDGPSQTETDPQREGRTRVMTPYSPFIVMDAHNVGPVFEPILGAVATFTRFRHRLLAASMDY